MDKNLKEVIGKMVDIGLEYNIDYVYLLEDIKEALEGKEYSLNDIRPENYM